MFSIVCILTSKDWHENLTKFAGKSSLGSLTISYYMDVKHKKWADIIDPGYTSLFGFADYDTKKKEVYLA